MKLFPNLCAAVVDCLHAIFQEKKYADKVLEKKLKENPKWGARDRRFIAETTYDIVRWFRLYRYLAECSSSDYWSLLGTWCIIHTISLPHWKEFQNIREEKILKRYDANIPRSIRESIPGWLDELGEKELGEKWGKELAASNETAKVVIRTNTLKGERSALKKLLNELEIETYHHKECDDALILKERQNIFSLPLFKEGWFELQDIGSQLIPVFLKVDAGMRVIDACAGAGGKTLQLAAIMKNKGKIIALDTNEIKLQELKKRARRAGASTIETRVIESKTIKRLDNSADRLLLDVPCSGSGVLKRNPDAKWKLSEEFISEIKTVQQTILNQYSVMLKPGGLLVYSTCSIFPSENRIQVNEFLEKNSHFEFCRDHQVFPSQGFDGFYMALLKRK